MTWKTNPIRGYPPWNQHSTWKWMVRILVSLWGPAYVQALLLLVSGSVIQVLIQVIPAFKIKHCMTLGWRKRTVCVPGSVKVKNLKKTRKTCYNETYCDILRLHITPLPSRGLVCILWGHVSGTRKGKCTRPVLFWYCPSEPSSYSHVHSNLNLT